MNGIPSSPPAHTIGSSGILPRNGIPYSAASRSPAPDANTSVTPPQWGHTKPLMFSTSPATGIGSLLQKSTDFETSSSDTRCGVVTMTADAPSSPRSSWHIVSGSSPVPGGTSTTSASNFPHSTCATNWRISPIFIGPRRITAVSGASRMNPTDTTSSGPASTGTNHPSGVVPIRLPSRFSIRGTLGPCKSMSSTPTRPFPSRASASAKFTATVLFPTPPLPDITTYLRGMPPSTSRMRRSSGFCAQDAQSPPDGQLAADGQAVDSFMFRSPRLATPPR